MNFASRRTVRRILAGNFGSLLLAPLTLSVCTAVVGCGSDDAAGTSSGGSGATGGSGAGAAAGTGGSAASNGDGGSGAVASGGSSGGEESTAVELAGEMGIGTNIGNSFDNTTIWETGWGQPLVTQAYLHGIASRGIKTVRVPVAWDTYAEDGVIDAAKLDRVKEVVSWIEAEGMFAIVNIHWDGGWIFSEGTANENRLTESAKTRFASYWHQIAAEFSSVGSKLILEGLNEEAKFYIGGDSDGEPDYAALNEINQLFVTTVRAEAGYNKTRALLVAGFATDIELTCVDDFAVPNDPAGEGKLFLSLHYYTPYPFCLQDTVESWGSPRTTWGTSDDEAELENLFDLAGEFSERRNLPVILGEFAVTVGDAYEREPASRALWMESVAQAALSRGMVPVLWDTGSDISRTDGSFSPEFQSAVDGVQ